MALAGAANAQAQAQAGVGVMTPGMMANMIAGLNAQEQGVNEMNAPEMFDDEGGAGNDEDEEGEQDGEQMQV